VLLVILCVEILHCFEIKQRVSSSLSKLSIGFCLEFKKLGSPLCDNDCNDEIDYHTAKYDPEKHLSVEHSNSTHNEDDFSECWEEREELIS
jgi:hypothetical protein